MMVVVVVMVMGPKERLRGMGSDEGGVGRRWDKARGFWGGGGGTEGATVMNIGRLRWERWKTG